MISKPLWEIYPKYIVVDRLYANNFSLHQGWFLITKKNLWLHVRSGGEASSMVTRFFCHCVLLMKAYSLRGNEWALSQLACLPLTQIPKNVGSSNGRRPDQIELNIRRRASCTGSKSDWENQRRHVAAFKTGMTWHLSGNLYLMKGKGAVSPRLFSYC